jgi:hypothetical protein
LAAVQQVPVTHWLLQQTWPEPQWVAASVQPHDPLTQTWFPEQALLGSVPSAAVAKLQVVPEHVAISQPALTQ